MSSEARRLEAKPELIPLCVPELHGKEAEYVKECLESGWVSSVGPFVGRFERAVADSVGAKHAVATVNGTAALHVALIVAGVRPEDEVLVSTLTFIAPANAIRYVGAWPVFIDAEPRYWQMDPSLVAEFLEKGCRAKGGVLFNRKTGRRVRAILPVDILGHPVDLDPILELARRYDLVLVEDATESLRAEYKGTRVGSRAPIACFSFNGNKIITTGGGGMVVTDDAALAERARYLTTQAKDDPVEYIHGAIGYNYRLTNVQAAMGVAQMEQLDAYFAAKRRIADVYHGRLSEISGLSPLRESAQSLASYWMYTLRITREEYGLGSRELLRRLEALGIQTRPLWQPIHLSTPHRTDPPAQCPVSESIHGEALSLPCSVGLTNPDQERVVRAITAIGEEVRA